MLSEAQPDFMLYNYFSDIFYILKAKKKTFKIENLVLYYYKNAKKRYRSLNKGKSKRHV
jgi:hypothetical protein